MINRKNIFLAVFLFLLLSSCERDPLERFSVVYEVEFVGTWNATSHPTDFPIDPHFSPFVVVSHLPNSRLFIEGLNASEGLKQVAETGSTSTLEEELQFFINTGEGLDVAVGDRLDSPGSSTKIQLGMREGYSSVTALSMVAPSPDWFVACVSVNLLYEDNEFVLEKTLVGHVYDAGTEDGCGFSLNYPETMPQIPITRITEPPLGDGTEVKPSLCTVVFTKQ